MFSVLGQSGVAVFGQSGGAAVEGMLPAALEVAVSKGDAHAMSPFIHTNVELILPEIRGVYERPHAVQILKKFLSSNPMNDFAFTYRMPRGNGYYAIGKMFTQNGNYRMIIWLKQTQGQLSIHQLRIEDEDE